MVRIHPPQPPPRCCDPANPETNRLTPESTPGSTLLMMNSECLRISDVAERSHVSVDTVRYYERKRLLSDVIRDGNGHRRFPPAVVDRILVIRHAAALGFTLDELAR